MHRALLIGCIVLSTLSCGDDDTGPSANPTDMTITITAAGVNPQNVTVTTGSRITFVNNDSAPHQPTSDPHPVHTDCPALNVSILNPGQQAQTGALNQRRTCGFHDHLNDTNASLRGTVTIQ